MYHASLTSETKSYCQHEFAKEGSIRCLVATVAFGMVSIITISVGVVFISYPFREWILEI